MTTETQLISEALDRLHEDYADFDIADVPCGAAGCSADSAVRTVYVERSLLVRPRAAFDFYCERHKAHARGQRC